MDRKFVIALSSLAGSIMLTEAHAIGLGEIKLRSSLNEPLRADIKLVQVKDLGENEILVNLAPQADFNRAKIDRDFLLTSLRFRLDLDNPNDPKVVVTTQQPIREPFLNFLVEVQWPSGRLLREYTLLMDLPVFAETKGSASSRNTKAATVPSERYVPEEEAVSEVRVRPSTPRASRPEIAKPESVPASEPRDSGVKDGSYGPTRSNDTLWKIAQSVRNGGSIHQNMLAIQKLNPGAFSNGNINQLKKGQVLKLPSREEVSSISRAEAIAQVDEQNKAWKSRGKSSETTGAQVDATSRTQGTPSASTQPDGQLKLTAPGSAGSSQTAQGAGESPSVEVDTLKNDLAARQEELDRVQRESAQNEAKAKELDSQINNAERLLELQSSEMAAMQAKLAAEQQAKAEASSTEAQTPVESVVKEGSTPEAADAQATAAGTVAQEASAATTPSGEEAAQSEAESATEAQPPVSEVASEQAAETPPALPPAEQPVPTAPEKKAPAAATQPESGDNTFIGGIIAVIVVLLGLFGYRRMASRDAQKEIEADSLVPYENEPTSYSDTDSQIEQTDDFESAVVDADVSTVVEQQPVAEAPIEPVQPETGDVLGEADIYISFGNFEKAESILKPAIQAEPRRTDLQLKLLELYKEMRNLAAFDEAYKQLAALGSEGTNARARDLRNRIPGADSVPLPTDEVSSLVSESALDEDFDLGFDNVPESESAPESTMETGVEEVLAATTGDDADFSLDLDLENDFTPAVDSESPAEIAVDDIAVAEVAIEEPAAPAGEFSLDFDLDLDLDLSTPVEEPVAQSNEAVGSDTAVQETSTATTDAGSEDEELGFLSNADEAATKLDLARAYIDMGDKEGARDILAEVIEEGQDEQKREAQALLDSIG